MICMQVYLAVLQCVCIDIVYVCVHYGCTCILVCVYMCVYLFPNHLATNN